MKGIRLTILNKILGCGAKTRRQHQGPSCIIRREVKEAFATGEDECLQRLVLQRVQYVGFGAGPILELVCRIAVTSPVLATADGVST